MSSMKVSNFVRFSCHLLYVSRANLAFEPFRFSAYRHTYKKVKVNATIHAHTSCGTTKNAKTRIEWKRGPENLLTLVSGLGRG